MRRVFVVVVLFFALATWAAADDDASPPSDPLDAKSKRTHKVAGQALIAATDRTGMSVGPSWINTDWDKRPGYVCKLRKKRLAYVRTSDVFDAMKWKRNRGEDDATKQLKLPSMFGSDPTEFSQQRVLVGYALGQFPVWVYFSYEGGTLGVGKVRVFEHLFVDAGDQTACQYEEINNGAGGAGVTQRRRRLRCFPGCLPTKDKWDRFVAGSGVQKSLVEPTLPNL
ncbi:hypothetical protein DFJ74DRAFT_475927 [Hyaloraphidium curvatum]|nr:hypothetical protein DFJ74DRAFT_475927 [Hyaloraphidium curvatum]